jgi:hypothetical protein
VDPAVREVVVEDLGLAAPQAERRLAFPGVGEPVHAGQLHTAAPVAERAEQPAGPSTTPIWAGSPTSTTLARAP